MQAKLGEPIRLDPRRGLDGDLAALDQRCTPARRSRPHPGSIRRDSDVERMEEPARGVGASAAARTPDPGSRGVSSAMWALLNRSAAIGAATLERASKRLKQRGLKAETFLATPPRWPWGRIATDSGAPGRRAAFSPGQGGPFELDCGRAPPGAAQGPCPERLGIHRGRRLPAGTRLRRRRCARSRARLRRRTAQSRAASRDAEARRTRTERPRQARRGDRPARPGRVRGDRTLVRADRRRPPRRVHRADQRLLRPSRRT